MAEDDTLVLPIPERDGQDRGGDDFLPSDGGFVGKVRVVEADRNFGLPAGDDVEGKLTS